MDFSSSSNHFHQRVSLNEEQILYDYLLQKVRQDSPAEILEDFRCLFIEGRGFRDAYIFNALEKIVKDKFAEQKFAYFFNRCCHILINHWQVQPQHQSAIPELVDLLDNLSSARSGYYTTANLIRHFIKLFTLSDQYTKLQRLARVINTKQGGQSSSVASLINRYPYLYNHCLLGEDSSSEHQQTVRNIKVQTERRFEVNLSRYVTYKVRLAQIAKSPEMPVEEGRIIRSVKNPTLLSDKELNRALKHYVGPIQDNYNYKTLSQNFANQTTHTSTFQGFKDELYDYLLGSMGNEGKGQFNKKIYNLLQNTLPECNHQKPTEFLMLRTSSQLLNYLVVESAHQPEHYIFIDMISNMGVTQTVGMLLKVVLMCKKVKPYLEKRFSILFNHYESFTTEGVPWLVKSLENMQLAFSVHFGKADLSCLKQVKLN